MLSDWRYLCPLFLNRMSETDGMELKEGTGILREERGVALIETILALAIIGLFMAAVLGFFMFGNITFRRGADHVYLQHSLRQAANYITHEVRYAVELEVLTTDDPLPSDPEDVDAGYAYIYYGGEADPRIYHLNGARVYPLTDPIVNGFVLSSEGQQFSFTITASTGGEEYAIDTMVLMLNAHPVIKDEAEVVLIPAIRYRNPEKK